MSRIVMLVAAPVVILACCTSAVADDAPHETNIAATARASLVRALRGPTEFDFADTPLSDVIDYLANKHDVVMILDNKGLTDAAVDPSAPVTKSVRKPIRLASGLKLILEEFDLTYTIRDDVLLITSKEKADEILTTKAYAVADLLGRSATRPVTMNHLIEAVVSIVRPESWDENGGPGTIVPMAETLLVNQTFDAHEQLADLLTLLRDALPEKSNKAAVNQPGAAEQAMEEEPRVVIYQLWHIAPDEAQQAITTLVAPESWQQQGGTGTAFGTSFAPPVSNNPNALQGEARRILAVRQTDDVQRQVRKLLRKLDESSTMGGFIGAMDGVGILRGDLAPNPAAEMPDPSTE
jgi:hypothetical protein